MTKEWKVEYFQPCVFELIPARKKLIRERNRYEYEKLEIKQETDTWNYAHCHSMHEFALCDGQQNFEKTNSGI